MAGFSISYAAGLGTPQDDFSSQANYPGNDYLNSSDQVVKIGGYIQFFGSLLDPYIYTAQEADQIALDKLRAQAELEKARAQAAGIQPTPVAGAVPGWAWALVGGFGVITVLLLMPKKEK